MAGKIKPKQVAAQFKWDSVEIADFCADALEDANDHNVAGALWALNVQEYDLACEFLHLEKDQNEAGELTPELSDRRAALMERLREARKKADA